MFGNDNLQQNPIVFALLFHIFPRLVAEMDVVLYCDFHGHNRKNNVFMYGCNSPGEASLKLHERVFPLMMSKNASNKVKSVHFNIPSNLYQCELYMNL